MNLSTEEQGQAKNVVVKSSMASWVAEIIGLLRPTCVLLNGLMGHLKEKVLTYLIIKPIP